jgi:hypothetical protein
MGDARGKITEIRQEQTLFHMHVEKWPTNHRNNGIFMSTKMIIFEARKFAVAHGVTYFAGKTSWRYTFLYVEALTISMLTRTTDVS